MLVLGFGEATVLGAVDTVVAAHLLDVDRVPQPLDGFDLRGGGRPSELDAHDRSVTDPDAESPATSPRTVRYRLRRMGQTPSGTVTFLFTDIEGSTRLWEDRPDEMRALVARTRRAYCGQ